MVSFLVKIICLQQLRFPQKDSLNLIFVTEFTESVRKRIRCGNLGRQPNPSPLGHQITDSQKVFKLTLQFMHIDFISPPVWVSKNPNTQSL